MTLSPSRAGAACTSEKCSARNSGGDAKSRVPRRSELSDLDGLDWGGAEALKIFEEKMLRE
jgi:hypothetical protein